MRASENITFASKKEMDILAALEEMKSLSLDMLEALRKA